MLNVWYLDNTFLFSVLPYRGGATPDSCYFHNNKAILLSLPASVIAAFTYIPSCFSPQKFAKSDAQKCERQVRTPAHLRQSGLRGRHIHIKVVSYIFSENWWWQKIAHARHEYWAERVVWIMWYGSGASSTCRRGTPFSQKLKHLPTLPFSFYLMWSRRLLACSFPLLPRGAHIKCTYSLSQPRKPIHPSRKNIKNACHYYIRSCCATMNTTTKHSCCCEMIEQQQTYIRQCQGWRLSARMQPKLNGRSIHVFRFGKDLLCSLLDLLLVKSSWELYLKKKPLTLSKIFRHKLRILDHCLSSRKKPLCCKHQDECCFLVH